MVTGRTPAATGLLHSRTTGTHNPVARITENVLATLLSQSPHRLLRPGRVGPGRTLGFTGVSRTRVMLISTCALDAGG